MNVLSFASFKFYLEAVTPINMPDYKGSTFRGAFGSFFKRVVCTLKNQECRTCLLNERCVYSFIFESPGVKNGNIPHPFILLPSLDRKKTYFEGELFSFTLTLVGKGMDYLPYFIYTFEEIAKRGIGKGSGRFKIVNVRNILPEIKSSILYDGETKTLKSDKKLFEIPSLLFFKDIPMWKKLSVKFITPTRIKVDNNLVVDLDFQTFIKALLRRISSLSYYHCENKLDIDFKGMFAEAAKVNTLARNFRWYDWERYSSRQDTKMRLGGFLGDIEFEGDLKDFIPYIRMGEFLHIGKSTSFGLGKYKIVKDL